MESMNRTCTVQSFGRLPGKSSSRRATKSPIGGSKARPALIWSGSEAGVRTSDEHRVRTSYASLGSPDSDQGISAASV